MSAGSPMVCSGVFVSSSVRSCSLPATTSSEEVRIEPGAIAFTRMRGFRSRAASFV
ncbi:Uncharacterised protein [Mycobacteroides abscessus subsp. abscessus]|nr:Uncharacterised protein [Mycobacteroides abscessus subsp. abscessus]